MIKKIFLLLAAFTVGSFASQAQYAPGSWKIYPMAGEHYESIIETPTKVYYLTGGSLYSYDKEYDETTYYTPGTRLSDTDIASLEYNKDSKYLMVLYSNGNIDLLYDDGTLVNMPEIKDANLTKSKTINDVAFYGGRIYLACDFGMVVFNDGTHSVIESGIYSSPLKTIMANDKYIFTVVDYKLYYSPIEEHHNTLDKFTPMSGIAVNDVYQLDNNNFLYTSGSGDGIKVYKLTVNVPTMSFTHVLDTPNLSKFEIYKDGYYGVCDKGIVFFDANGNHTQTLALDESISSQLLATWNGPKSVWGADGYGVADYDLSGTTPVVLSDKFKAEASLLFASGSTTPSPDGKSVYVTRIGMTECHPGGDASWSQHLPFICERFDWASGSVTPVFPYGYRNISSTSQAEQDKYNSKYFMGGPANTLIDPVDPDLIYHANQFEGLVIVKNREILYQYNTTNSPIVTSWNSRVEGIAFDQFGNLWVGCWMSSGKSPLLVLPAAALAKLRQDPSSVTTADWQTVKWPSSDPGKMDLYMVFSKHNTNKMFYMRGGWNGPIVGYDNKGTSSLSDDTYVLYNGFIDQDGTVTTPQFKPCAVEDNTGNIWIGTTSGIFVIKDLAQLGVSNGSTNLSVIRPKVSRNDGTNYADYLLSSETILSIAVDPTNRKWIATGSSGLYLVNADGTEILEHFTAENSPLMSNSVYTVACDPNGNGVLIGTPNGMMLYSSTSTPASDNYDEVYAYPNPVRPDYTGWITINGLMQNSLVKIADMQGNVFWEGRSEGGMVVWDGCNRDGSRVRSGVYLVFASQSGDNGSSGKVVTKIVVIN